MAQGVDTESDGIEEALESTVRLAAMAGARLGSEIARAREEQLRKQRRIDEREAEQLARRLEAEKRTAVAELTQVHRPDWWERADREGAAERIGQTYATARAWAPEADEAARAEQKMRQELHERYGITLDHADSRTMPSSIQAELAAWRQRLEQQRRREAGSRTGETAERGEAAVLLDQAAHEDRDRFRDEGLSEDRARDITGEAHRLYDSADRRAADLRAMEAKGIDPEVAQSRMHADLFRAEPATKATVGARRGRAPKARKATNRGAENERAGIER